MAVAWGNMGSFGMQTKFGSPSPSGGGEAPPSAMAALQSQFDMVQPGIGMSPSTVIIGLALLLVGLKVIGEHGKTDISPAHFHIGAYNILTVTVTSIVGIVLLKWLVNRYPVPGLTDVVNTV